MSSESEPESEEQEETASDSEPDVEEKIRAKVADIPFEDLQKARSDGRSAAFSRTKHEVNTKRANKNRPMEVTCKKPVGRFREIIQAPKRVIRDPRFESLCGKFDESRFKAGYKFLYDEELPAERQRLQKLMAKSKGIPNKESETHLAWIDKMLREEDERRKQDMKAKLKNVSEKAAVKQGKRPFYLKKSELRKQELTEKFHELKEKGQLEKFMEKRRRKNASKDHRYVPYKRQNTG